MICRDQQAVTCNYDICTNPDVTASIDLAVAPNMAVSLNHQSERRQDLRAAEHVNVLAELGPKAAKPPYAERIVWNVGDKSVIDELKKWAKPRKHRN
jgi:uncharacterized protein (UPF0147 family)